LEDFEDLTSTPLSLDRPDGEDWDEEEHEEFEEDLHVRSEVGEIMMELWEPKGEDAVVESLQKMSLLAQERSNNLKIIRTAGAIPLLVDMVKPSPHVSRSHSLAIECFAHLSKNILNRIEIAESGGLTPLLSCLAVVEETDLLHILNCLFECSKSPLKIRAMLRKAGAIETLLPLITVGNEAVQILLLDIIKLYSDEESQQVFGTNLVGPILTDSRLKAIQYANGIPSIIQLIGTGTPKIQKRAMRTLASLCGSNVKTQASLHKTEAIDTIVTLLGSKDEGVQKAAAETLTLLTMNDFTNQSAARKAGGIKLVVPLLSSRDNAVKVRACLAIRSLAKGNVKVQCEFREAGALKSLIRLLEESSDGVIFHATSAVEISFSFSFYGSHTLTRFTSWPNWRITPVETLKKYALKEEQLFWCRFFGETMRRSNTKQKAPFGPSPARVQSVVRNSSECVRFSPFNSFNNHPMNKSD
jgi:hypothetical protein